MLLFPHCKINIGLRITAKRADGFHDIESIFFPVPWHDALEIIESDQLTLSVTGIEIPGDTSNNLCMCAWRMLKEDYPELPPVEIHLHKTIPTGAGLGGGSSNGAFMLKALDTKFKLGVGSLRLYEYALRLGSDCPFFIKNQPAVARGRGDILTPINLTMQGSHLVLANPGIHVSTAWAFGELNPYFPEKPIEDLIMLPVNEWGNAGIKNDFEEPVLGKYPIIGAVKSMMLEKGADFAAMSGTGSTCFGIFSKDPALTSHDFPDGTLVKSFVL
jgi:4-diphosphocytidyl-2-C-methyl-D-erythritol kinase